MDEHVLALGADDEAEALDGVEPLDVPGDLREEGGGGVEGAGGGEHGAEAQHLLLALWLVGKQKRCWGLLGKK